MSPHSRGTKKMGKIPRRFAKLSESPETSHRKGLFVHGFFVAASLNKRSGEKVKERFV